MQRNFKEFLLKQIAPALAIAMFARALQGLHSGRLAREEVRMSFKDMLEGQAREIGEKAKALVAEKGKEIVEEAKGNLSEQVETLEKGLSDKVSSAIEEQKGKLTDKLGNVLKKGS